MSQLDYLPDEPALTDPSELKTFHLILPASIQPFLDARAAAEGHDTAENFLEALVVDGLRRAVEALPPAERDAFYERQRQELRADLAVAAEQSARGESHPLDIEDIKARGRKLLSQRRAEQLRKLQELIRQEAP